LTGLAVGKTNKTNEILKNKPINKKTSQNSNLY